MLRNTTLAVRGFRKFGMRMVEGEWWDNASSGMRMAWVDEWDSASSEMRMT